MEIILATRNPSKALQIRAVFSGSDIQVRTLDDAGIEGEAAEDGTTLEENSSKKAWYAHERSSDTWTMADDTGIFIAALNGEPGIHAASWAGNVSTEEITAYCLKRLKGAIDRSAVFRTVVLLISPAGEKHVFTGEVSGTILEAPRVPPQPKMPYSPIFVPDGQNLCWAEMSIEYENTISQRGIAFRKARTFLESIA